MHCFSYLFFHNTENFSECLLCVVKVLFCQMRELVDQSFVTLSKTSYNNDRRKRAQPLVGRRENRKEKRH